MKKEIKPVDFDLLKECCKELGVTLVPAESNEYIKLTDENGKVYKIFAGKENIFNFTEE